jgi:hypothetical protein
MTDDSGKSPEEGRPGNPGPDHGLGRCPRRRRLLRGGPSDKEARARSPTIGSTLIKEEEQAIPTARDRLEGTARTAPYRGRHSCASSSRPTPRDLSRPCESRSARSNARAGASRSSTEPSAGSTRTTSPWPTSPKRSSSDSTSAPSPMPGAKLAEQMGIEVRTYGIIYELLDDIEATPGGPACPRRAGGRPGDGRGQSRVQGAPCRDRGRVLRHRRT